MTHVAEKLLDLLHEVEEASFQDGRVMNDPKSTSQACTSTYKATLVARTMLINHLRTMTEEDLKSL